jgi:hypothetical protein
MVDLMGGRCLGLRTVSFDASIWTTDISYNERSMKSWHTVCLSLLFNADVADVWRCFLQGHEIGN